MSTWNVPSKATNVAPFTKGACDQLRATYPDERRFDTAHKPTEAAALVDVTHNIGRRAEAALGRVDRIGLQVRLDNTGLVGTHTRSGTP